MLNARKRVTMHTNECDELSNTERTSTTSKDRDFAGLPHVTVVGLTENSAEPQVVKCNNNGAVHGQGIPLWKESVPLLAGMAGLGNAMTVCIYSVMFSYDSSLY